MQKLLKQSINHWLMAVITFFLSFDERIGLTLIGATIFSLIVGLLIEVFQYIDKKFVKDKKLNSDYYIASAVDVIVTIASGILGYYITKFIKLIFKI